MNIQLSLSPDYVEGHNDHDVTGLHRTVNRRSPMAAKDDYGNSVIKVPLPDGTHAVLNDRDFFHLMDNHLTDQWLVNDNGRGTGFVRCMYHGKLTTVARLITNAPANSSVRVINSDHLDLRRRNLKVISCKPRGASS
ncbi:MAG: hypothetical protein HOC33_19610 [Alphaproteobacteria bacterium]|jgi:hypothetical protein|nr:hypothetical protein [Alphaproteobacteria bacterium]MBT4085056.1 hypothetical protein [Alphaproteobacteria bacterium]MBT4546070.1 hypothetical protein [Alphaproteobacteria bacterium]